MKDIDTPGERDVPLPSTLAFVLVMAVAFLAGWLVLFLLLKARV